MSRVSASATLVGGQAHGVDGYEYGNARLRARRGDLLDDADLRELFHAGSPDRMLGVLRSTSYGPDVEHALVHRDPLARLDTTVRTHLARSLGDLRRFYGGHPAAGVELLLGRWDLRNLVTIVRSAARPTAAVEVESMLVPAGSLTAVELVELSKQPSLRSVIELMVAWDLPSRDIARRLLRAWPEYELAGDPIVFEQELASAWADSVVAALDDWSGSDLESILRAESDHGNVLAVLRSRDDERLGAPPRAIDDPLPGGTLGLSVLDELRSAPTDADVVAVIAAQRLPGGWLSAIERWAGHHDLGVLGSDLERTIARTAIGLFSRGDPLGISIPVAYVFAKECEARNLRLVGRALLHRLDWVEIETEWYPW